MEENKNRKANLEGTLEREKKKDAYLKCAV